MHTQIPYTHTFSDAFSIDTHPLILPHSSTTTPTPTHAITDNLSSHAQTLTSLTYSTHLTHKHPLSPQHIHTNTVSLSLRLGWASSWDQAGSMGISYPYIKNQVATLSQQPQKRISFWALTWSPPGWAFQPWNQEKTGEAPWGTQYSRNGICLMSQTIGLAVFSSGRIKKKTLPVTTTWAAPIALATSKLTSPIAPK